jgi:SAM-dependent methyltransferase
MKFSPETIATVKEKRELAGLEDHIIRERVEKKLEQDKKLREKVATAHSFKELSRSALFKEFIKEVRADLRTIYGVFDLDEKRKRQDLVKKIAEDPNDKEILAEMLALHQSSKERLLYYPEIYRKIFAITGTPTSILDLACGANPYSYGMLGCAPRYFAIDLPSEELKGIALYFKSLGLKGGVLGGDVIEKALPEKLPHVDVCFLFKALDTFETQQRNVSGKIFDSIKATWLVVSFPTMSLGGKKHIRSEKRAWFEKLIERKGWHATKFEVGSEMFYTVLKEPDRQAETFYAEQTAPKAEELGQYMMQAELATFHGYLRNGKVLDAGCGPGRDVRMLTKNGYTVTGIDSSEKMVKIAQERNPDTKILVGDIRRLPFADALFDGVWSLASTVHFYEPDVLRALREYYRVLKPGGVLYIGVKAGKDVLEERFGARIFYHQHDPETFLALVRKAGFEVLEHVVAPRYANNEGRSGEFLNAYARKKA